MSCLAKVLVGRFQGRHVFVLAYHYPRRDELHLILKSSMTMAAIAEDSGNALKTLQVILEAGDMLVVPRGRTHYAEVIGDQACEFVDASRR